MTTPIHMLTDIQVSQLIQSAINTHETQIFRTFNQLRRATRDHLGYDVRPQFPEYGTALTFMKGRTHVRNYSRVWGLGDTKPTPLPGPVKIVECNFDLSDFYIQSG